MSYKLVGFNTRNDRIEYSVLHNLQGRNTDHLSHFLRRLKRNPRYKTYDVLGVVDMTGRLVFKL